MQFFCVIIVFSFREISQSLQSPTWNFQYIFGVLSRPWGEFFIFFFNFFFRSCNSHEEIILFIKSVKERRGDHLRFDAAESKQRLRVNFSLRYCKCERKSEIKTKKTIATKRTPCEDKPARCRWPNLQGNVSFYHLPIFFGSYHEAEFLRLKFPFSLSLCRPSSPPSETQSLP